MKEKTLDDYIYLSLIITSILLFIAIIIYNNCFSHIPISSCFIYDNLGIYCPGCGCTRAFLSLLNFNIINSFFHNSAVLYTVIILLFYLITQTIDRILNRPKHIMPYSNIYLYIGIFILILNCIIKNILLLVFHISM